MVTLLEKLDAKLQQDYRVTLDQFNGDLSEVIGWLESNHAEKSEKLVQWIEWAEYTGDLTN